MANLFESLLKPFWESGLLPSLLMLTSSFSSWYQTQMHIIPTLCGSIFFCVFYVFSFYNLTFFHKNDPQRGHWINFLSLLPKQHSSYEKHFTSRNHIIISQALLGVWLITIQLDTPLHLLLHDPRISKHMCHQRTYYVDIIIITVMPTSVLSCLEAIKMELAKNYSHAHSWDLSARALFDSHL